ncbi:putative CRAL-TRIO lipid binding domain-containing protein [Helianthus annuus]|uniref:CRAL-TRIO lipid binding domain-containing protein n=1 Tax=Helianthus annuus TaxID=4232 RepID=A0A9K3EDD2_HELAN|nr:putative CRAL-TRIO lipid binding domain-containing protein [Helianthus annuus]KAJ0436492.1 putative CRAL-TRIO lipid binding domain-containing protein [Helianthus annuus]KAJ0470176.1 putative CRAL-TRIO lipid binding domain-containing protein [Helianthus annuus]KAJ0486973.1 putative CRAL-TRIO lipid binding domain-containing protein [Helianthus annuus]
MKSQIHAGRRGLGKLTVDVITCRFDVRNDEEMQQGEEEALFCTLCNVKVEYEVLRLLGLEHSQITVLMDFGLSFFGILVKTLRSCIAFLQDYYPTRLGCLLVVWLPSIARVITQTQFQVSMFDFVLFFTSPFLVRNHHRKTT